METINGNLVIHYLTLKTEKEKYKKVMCFLVIDMYTQIICEIKVFKTVSRMQILRKYFECFEFFCRLSRTEIVHR